MRVVTPMAHGSEHPWQDAGEMGLAGCAAVALSGLLLVTAVGLALHALVTTGRRSPPPAPPKPADRYPGYTPDPDDADWPYGA